jgi:hypothetical protein
MLGAMLLLSGCPNNSSNVIKPIIDSCADDHLTSNAVLYFGPSNQIGPGSIWARLGVNGGYQPQWRVDDLGLDYLKVVQPGKAFQCDFSKNSTFTAGGGLSVLSQAANVSAEVKSDLARAKAIKVSASEVAWDTVIAGPYLVELNAIVDANIKSDVYGKNRLVVRRALRLSGYKAMLEFDSSVKPEIKAKYDGVKLGATAVGEVGAQLSAKWTTDDKLELTALESVYVAGEFAELINGEFVSTKGDENTIQDLGDKFIKPFDSIR